MVVIVQCRGACAVKHARAHAMECARARVHALTMAVMRVECAYACTHARAMQPRMCRGLHFYLGWNGTSDASPLPRTAAPLLLPPKTNTRTPVFLKVFGLMAVL
jgi:hypothetical protein